MKRLLLLLTLAALALAAAPTMSTACTTMVVTNGASADGSMLVAHSDDDELGDQRIIYVPARDYPKGAKRPVYEVVYPYPRLVTNRAPGYMTKGAKSRVLGYIPQARHTYAYFDGNYGIMNEKQLIMGECTNGAKFEPDPVPQGGGSPSRIMYSAELSRIALERCAKARDAVKLMGELIDTYGLYSTGETLLVADTREAWVFEMAPLPHRRYHSAWVAKRVPDGTVFVAANEFRIRDIRPGDPDIMYSKHLFPGLKALGWWDVKKQGTLDWLKAVSHGEYNHPYYSLRRVWRVLDRVNPGLGLSPWVEDGFTRAYPFSVRPVAKLTPRDVFSLYRDHYEGTPFDMTKGVAAGPYGYPNRFTGPYDPAQNDVSKTKPKGAWERPISVFYQGYTFVNQARHWLPDEIGGITWFGADVSNTTVFVPFYAGVTDLPRTYQIGSAQTLDRNAAWWAFDFVANWARINYQLMLKADIRPMQKKLEDLEFRRVAEVDKAALALFKDDPAKARKYLTDYCNKNADMVVGQWWKLGDRLIAKYSDGYINVPGSLREYGYPASWLKATDYYNGPTSYDMK